jgi:hypothetical protein
MARLTLTLTVEEKDALRTLAEKELRNSRDQARLILRQKLEVLKLLLPEAEKTEARSGN